MFEFGLDSLFVYALIIGSVIAAYYFFKSKKKNAK